MKNSAMTRVAAVQMVSGPNVAENLEEAAHWIAGAPPARRFTCTAQTRYRQPDEPCTVEVLDDGSVYPLPGKLLFSDTAVDAATGQVSLRAELPNPEGLLLPGMYVRVRLEQAQVDGGILLPQQAVTRGAQADTVMVVDDKGMVSPRQIKLGGAKGSDWVVLGGLKTGEQVMVDGFQKMMNPKAPVKAVPWQQPSAQAGMGAAPAPTAAASAAASK